MSEILKSEIYVKLAKTIGEFLSFQLIFGKYTVSLDARGLALSPLFPNATEIDRIAAEHKDLNAKTYYQPNSTPQIRKVIKILAVGGPRTGKSSLVTRYSDDRYQPMYDLTIGVEFASKTITMGTDTYKLQIWDTAGSPTFRSITRSYYRGSHGVLLCFDITDRESFEQLTSWQQDLDQFCADSATVLVGCKCDLDSLRKVTVKEANVFADDHDIQYFETSAKTGEGVDLIFTALASMCAAETHVSRDIL
eukprot:TRINITY_DN4388_c0_g6_i1.p1 TRINITY_DN4388_c0_g6~~TRINITY_DN4388_c0_g6_i1.p1  ORF type:complete len:275 (+),score=18.18 TRINITY_DN4388_c0_g6_i1:78-827(+)